MKLRITDIKIQCQELSIIWDLLHPSFFASSFIYTDYVNLHSSSVAPCLGSLKVATLQGDGRIHAEGGDFGS